MAHMYYEAIKNNLIYSHQNISKTYVFVCVWSYTKRGNKEQKSGFLYGIQWDEQGRIFLLCIIFRVWYFYNIDT